MVRGLCFGCVMALSTMGGEAAADVIAATAEHYALMHERNSELAPDALWARLIRPEIWWHSDHTYSGDAGNLSLEAKAGGLWREDWEGGSVVHGTVLLAQPGESLRLEAPFGPLQGMAVQVVWTISIVPDDDGGSVVTFSEVANGSTVSGLDQIAPAVDAVKTEAINRLVVAPSE